MVIDTFCYGPVEQENARSLDLYTSPKANENTPLVIFIHGGAWRTEDKSDYKTLAMDCLSLSLLEKDETVSKIQHPSHLQDVQEAIEFLINTPPTNTYDPKQIYLVGHSAGAHIAMMLLLGYQVPVKGVLGVSGIYDIPLLLNTFPSYLDFIHQAFGDSDYYQASPVSLQTSSSAKVIIAHSQQDSLIDNQQAEVMTHHLKSLNINVLLDMNLEDWMAVEEEFYVRYYSGHKGKYGHEFLEFEFRSDGLCRYANNSNYRKDSLIKKEMYVSPAVIEELKRIIKESQVMKEDDSQWPEKNIVGSQEIEVRLGNEHISFEVK
ncbi:hypothetical protein G6F46_009754 [Rhizopus delemar]|uniref:BD-FAE-like domain-containing protein n=2 Tax=Rhizopus TaxID=4842 RepID=A0A9P6YU24_9FUNG|nr:hypothetical protein G6F43_010186 [Rhizopus delemar]KAG1541182.1 hypothetical protein G6F51_008057 [Rhizopus arrhizus]KAG1447337.1 hypothetical protein G6F55_011148 [Rhizopus delemar]KAG1489512.1 hypothetical protein G6F54_011381 [Rhizopus delemar]KAG1515003.1 hypothetical protein G6F52_009782 [Rhizopus delemar]